MLENKPVLWYAEARRKAKAGRGAGFLVSAAEKRGDRPPETEGKQHGMEKRKGLRQGAAASGGLD